MKYIFLHIPKTGGTSMRQALMRSFREEDTASCYRIGQVEEDLAQAIKEEKKLIVGHIDFSHINAVSLPDEYKLMAMFREPAERIISTYLHFQKHNDPQYSSWKGGEVSFEEFMKTEFANNWTCQLLGGTKGLTGDDSYSREVFAAAKTNFKRLDWIGTMERFEDSLFSLSQFLGRTLKNPGKYNEGGDMKKHLELRAKYRLDLVVRNGNDTMIYQAADRRLSKQLSNIKLKKVKKAWFNLRSGH